MKILITGGAGYLGSVITEKMLDAGHEVTVLDNLLFNQISPLQFTSNPKYHFIYGDVRNENLLRHEVGTHDVIIPLAAIVGFPACKADPKLAWEVNYEQIKLLECSSAICFRLATVFGTSTRMRTDLLVNEFVYKAMTDKYITVFEKHFKRNFIHIQDVANVFLWALNNYETMKHNVYNVGLSDANLSKQELLEKIQQYIPDFAISYSDFYEDPDKRDYIVSNKKIEKTGWKPEYSLDDGIRELMKTYQVLIPRMTSEFRNGFPLGYAQTF